ncbi:MAG: hypothetical protein OXH65_00760 [Paracoccaceae bacterium]|nr:hypothetical protein [Paracoccaceae bacterium]
MPGDRATIQIVGKDLEYLKELKDRFGLGNIRNVVRYLLVLQDINEELGSKTLYESSVELFKWMEKNGIEKQTAKQMVMLEKLKTDYNADVAMMLANFIATEFQMWGDKPEGENQ